jgi:hypothetical protein
VFGMTTQTFPTKQAFEHDGQEYAFQCTVHGTDSAEWRIGGSLAIHFDATTREYVIRVSVVPRSHAHGVWADYMPDNAFTESRERTYSRAKVMAAFWRQKVRYSAQIVATMPR